MDTLNQDSIANASSESDKKAKVSWGVGLLTGFVAAGVMTALMNWGSFRLDTPFPPALLAEKMFAIIPMQVFNFFITFLGEAAKPLAFYSAIAGYIVIGAVLGVLFPVVLRGVSTRRLWLDGILYAVVIWILTMALFMPLVGGGFWGMNLYQGALRGGFGILVYQLIYGILLGLGYTFFSKTGGKEKTSQVMNETAKAPDSPANPARREVLRKLAVGIVAFGAANSIVGILEKVADYGLAFAQELFSKIKGLSPEITPTPDFYNISKNVRDPNVDVGGWKLEIKGLVDNPYSITYDELRALPAVEQYANLMCISNPVGGRLIGNALWKGVRLQNLLSRAGAKSEANELILRAAENYSDSFPLAKGMKEETILAYDMNGERLNAKHGAPARIIVPGIYGMKNVKWLTSIELANFDYKGFWESRGWSDLALIKTMSRIDTPKKGARVPVGEKTYIAGISFAGIRGIKEVEVTTDGGFFYNKATIKESISPYSWTLWAYEWEPKDKGNHTIIVRAIDGTGKVQTADHKGSLPDGAQGRHTIKVRVV